MGILSDHSNLYSNIPLSTNANRDEHILIEVLGSWIPECELMYYGLLGSDYSEKLYKLKNISKINPKDIYLDMCFFSGDDIIKYLASTDYSLNESLSEEFLNDATNTALDEYLYVPCSETMIRHSIIELAYFDFVKSITLLYPWDVRKIDYAYLNTIIPPSIMQKIVIGSGDTLGFIKNKVKENVSYTTIITNDMDTVNTLIDKNDEYNTNESLFLLRNSSRNTEAKLFTNEDGKQDIEFNELGNEIVVPKLMDLKNLVPKNKMRFGRFDPYLFEDMKPNEKDFSYGE